MDRRAAHTAPRRFVLAALAVGALAASRAAAVPTYLSTVDIECFTDRTTVSRPVSTQFETCSAFSTTAMGRVDSDVGVIRAEASSSLTLGGTSPTISATGQAVARFQDSFLVAALDATGASVLSGFLTAVVDVDAEVGLSSALGGDSLFGSILWNFSVGSEGANGRALATLPFGSASDTSGGHFVLQVPWSAGTPVAIEFFANAETSVAAQTAGTRTSVADFGSSMTWGGITGVTDAAGVPVASFTALGSGGFDYSAAVPEPGALALLALGLAGIGVQARRARAA